MEVKGASIGIMISVLISSMFNIENLFTSSDWSILFTSHTEVKSMFSRLCPCP